MNKPAFVFDGRLLVDAQKLSNIGFKVRSILAFGGRTAVKEAIPGNCHRSRRVSLDARPNYQPIEEWRDMNYRIEQTLTHSNNGYLTIPRAFLFPLAVIACYLFMD